MPAMYCMLVGALACTAVLVATASDLTASPNPGHDVAGHPDSAVQGTRFFPQDEPTDEFAPPPGIEEPPVQDPTSPAPKSLLVVKTKYSVSGQVKMYGKGMLTDGKINKEASQQLRTTIADQLEILDHSHVHIGAAVVGTTTGKGTSIPDDYPLKGETLPQVTVTFQGNLEGERALARTLSKATLLEVDTRPFWKELHEHGYTEHQIGPAVDVVDLGFAGPSGQVLDKPAILNILAKAGVGLKVGNTTVLQSKGQAGAGSSGVGANVTDAQRALAAAESDYHRRVAGRKAKRLGKEEVRAGLTPGTLGPKQILVSDIGKCVDSDPQGDMLGGHWSTPSKILHHEESHKDRQDARAKIAESGHKAASNNEQPNVANLVRGAELTAAVSVNEPNGTKSRVMVAQVEGTMSKKAAAGTELAGNMTDDHVASHPHESNGAFVGA